MATTLQFVNEVTIERPQELASARMMAKFFFASFWLIIFTGAIRKWIFPGVSIMYLAQDVPIGLSYLYALWSGMFTKGIVLVGILLMTVVIMLQALAQIVLSGHDFFVAVVGLHNYLFYLPILIVYPLSLTLKYRKNFVWWNLILSIPMCLLAIAQNRAPKQAWVNRTSEGDAFGIPGVDVARVTGTFNFTVFYGVWVGLAVALCMGEWLLPPERRVFKKTWLLILCTFTVNMCHLVSASRSAILLSAMSVVGGLAAALVLRSSKAVMTILGICILLPIGAGVTYFISPEEFNVVVTRFTGDEYIEDGQNRIEGGLIGFATEPEFSLIGAGIGQGVDASHVGNSNTYNFTYTLSEGDMIRTVMELGTPVGLFYALTRIGFLFIMVALSVQIVRAGSSPHVLPIAFFCLAQAYQGDLTRAATMTASQVMVGYAFILGAYYHPDNTSPEALTGDLLTRSA